MVNKFGILDNVVKCEHFSARMPALVGISGIGLLVAGGRWSGKSALIDLLSRFH